ncbi:hypothetical protein HanIR_Chr10g0475781 [Helianthus annuus]|nr:hypothetical protein HanIR_Chr10g0475781 [Helianthus annuus]
MIKMLKDFFLKLFDFGFKWLKPLKHRDSKNNLLLIIFQDFSDLYTYHSSLRLEFYCVLLFVELSS